VSAELLARLRSALPERYTIERELGRGGMATVWLGEDHKFPRAVAVKVLHPELATSLGVERFLREIQTTAVLNHPLLVPLFDSGEAGGLLYYIMPYIEGETLRTRLKREPQLPIPEALQVTGDVAEALSYAHSHGVVHRDIKPENIMCYAGRALVTDFGIARAVTAASLEPLTKPGIGIGTPEYMSPEQAANEGEIDGRSDLYSLGCVLYELLTGSPPFTGATAQAVIARHRTDRPLPICSARPTVPVAVERAVFKALEKAPADRFATAGQFAAALRAQDVAAVDHDDGQSIAVLPFANLSAEPEFEYFGEGIADGIITALGRLPGLHVAARTSSFAFRNKGFDVAEVGAKLKVATVLEGGVRKDRQHLRVTAQLINATDGFQRWSERYDREMTVTDILAIQDEIAKAIADRLAVTFDSGALPRLVTPSTGSLDAYHLYLKGRHYVTLRGLGLRRAVQCFEQALAVDPDYALAHAGLAEACTLLVQYGLATAAALGPKAHAAADRALALAPDLAEAHCALGALYFVVDWDWTLAARHLHRAIELNSRYDAPQSWLAYLLVFVAGQFEEGIALGRRAAEFDPLAPLPAMQLGMTLMGAGRWEAAIPPLERAAKLAPTMFLPPLHLGIVYNGLGRTAEAIASLELALATSGRHPWALAALGICYHSLGKLGDVQAIRDELAARARREHVQRVWLGVLSAALGRMDEAFELLDQACEERDGILPYAKRYPFFALLQQDPRMERIYRRIGLPDESRGAGESSPWTERPRRRGPASSSGPGLRAPEPPA
jgi:TolB-like protein/Flp pilus assembly protein TadD